MRTQSISRIAAMFAAAALAAGCGGGGGGDAASPAPAPVPAPPASPAPPAPAASTETSYANFKQVGLTPQAVPGGSAGAAARGYSDFTGSGRLDLFRAVLTYNAGLPIAQATPSRFEFLARQADGSLVAGTTPMAPADGCIHPRKALVADFNGDDRPDVFVVCHGYDAQPFPGERNKVVLSQAGGGYAVADAAADTGFFHGGAAADLDGDGDVDVIVANNFDPETVYAFLNDGHGSFTRDATSRVPAALKGKNYFSVELADVNEDGKPDLIVGGHEWEGAATAVLINPGNGNFSGVTPTVLPAVANEGVVLDFTLTGTGASRTLWVLRTSGGDGTFYQSRVLQKVDWTTLASSLVVNERPGQWVPWALPAVVGGTAVITTDIASDALSYTLPQTGFNGSFTVYPNNEVAEAFDRTLAANVVNGAMTMDDAGTTLSYQFAYPTSDAGGCSASGGTGADTVGACAQRAAGQLITVCAAPTDGSPLAVLVRNDAGATLQAATLDELKAAAGSGMVFKGVKCDGTADDDDVIELEADGSAVSTYDDGSDSFDAATVTALFSSQGATFPGEAQAGIKAFKHTANGTTRYFLLNYGKPLAGSSDTSFAPVLFAQP